MELMSRGRKPGYKHSEDTKDKIRKSLEGVPRGPRPQETKDKIRRSLSGTSHPEERRENIAKGKSLYELDEKCLNRFEEMKANYPEQEEFFVENRDELLFAMRDVRTENELSDIRRYVETAALRPDEPYQYSSTSCYAAEDAMIALLDFKRLLQKYH
jgi:hypothetical protein